jgi:hypothetical protein
LECCYGRIAHSDAGSYCVADVNAGIDTNADTDSKSNGNSDSGTNTNTNINTDACTDPDSAACLHIQAKAG